MIEYTVRVELQQTKLLKVNAENEEEAVRKVSRQCFMEYFTVEDAYVVSEQEIEE